MNRYPYPRPLPALLRECGFLVSSAQKVSVRYLFSLHLTPRCKPSSLHSTLEVADHALLCDFLKLLHPISPIQST
jgi:hypothetical protein